MGTYEIGGRKWTFRCHWQISRQKWINLKSINIRPIIIIKQIQNMNLMLNMKDVNKILAKTHFKCKKVRKKTYFLQVWWALASCIFISYCCLCQCQAVCYYYLPVPTKYHWNIFFQKKCSSKYVVKNARNVTQFVWQPFSIGFQGFVKQKDLNIYTRILDIMKQ